MLSSIHFSAFLLGTLKLLPPWVVAVAYKGADLAVSTWQTYTIPTPSAPLIDGVGVITGAFSFMPVITGAFIFFVVVMLAWRYGRRVLTWASSIGKK